MWVSEKFGNLFIEHQEKTSDRLSTPLYSLTIEEGITQKTERYEREHLITKENEFYKIVPPKAFVYNPMNLRFGALAPNLEDFPICVSGYYNVFSLKNEETIGFWQNYLISNKMLQHYFSIATGSLIEKLRVHYSQFVEIVKPLPSTEEQIKISNFLNKIDFKIRKQKELINALKKYKRGLLRDIFAKLSESGEKRCLKEISVLFADGDWIESKDQATDGIRLVQTGNVGFGVYLDKPHNAKYISEATFQRLNCLEINDGDILISRLPEPAGRACLLPPSEERRITAVDCTVIRTNGAVIDRNYLLQFLCSEHYLKTVNSFLAGGTRQRISRKNLEGIEVPYPSIDQQKYYGTFLCKVDTRISNAEHHLNCLNRLRCFMLQQLFI